ncbi:hypothetical protein VOLCADRAFT_43537, partial [Volvox carteri f. nagariensis]
VVNCAAVSQPGVCESSPEVARSVNVPSHLAHCMLDQARRRGLCATLIHFSTDQVYDGSHALWKEGEPCGPVNTYGKTKWEAEQLPESTPVAILRASIIYGPPPPDPVNRALFLQFVASAVRGSQPTAFFEDEWRSPIYVRDLERLVTRLLAPWQHRIFNVGGPERLSRVDMARQVADALGCGYDAILATSTASVNRGVASPADISMDVSRLTDGLHFRTTPFREALK